MASFNDKEPTAPPFVSASANDLAGGDSSVPLDLIVELPRFRRVSRHFRDTIDLKGNQCLLIAPGVAQSMHRFNTFIKRYCEFPMESEDGGPDAFLDAIFDFLSLRKLDCEIRTDWEFSLDQFSSFWLERSVAGKSKAFSGCEALVLTDHFSEMWERALEGLMPEDDFFENIYGDKGKAMLNRIQAFACNDEKDDSPLAADLTGGIPVQYSDSMFTGIKERDDEMERLRYTLQVPVLPGISPYAYYNLSSWAEQRLEKAMVRNEEIRGIERE